VESIEELSTTDLGGRIEVAEPDELRPLAWELLRRLRVAESLAWRPAGAEGEREELDDGCCAALEGPGAWNDPHFPEGTPEDEILAHLEAVHDDRAPWGNAFVDDFGQEYPPRVVGVHAWCHRADEADSITPGRDQ